MVVSSRHFSTPYLHLLGVVGSGLLTGVENAARMLVVGIVAGKAHVTSIWTLDGRPWWVGCVRTGRKLVQ